MKSYTCPTSTIGGTQNRHSEKLFFCGWQNLALSVRQIEVSHGIQDRIFGKGLQHQAVKCGLAI